jgi:phage-related protein
VSDSRKRIREFIDDAKKVVGRELYRTQCGSDPSDWKPMNTIGAAARQMRVQEDGPYCVIYVAKFAANMAFYCGITVKFLLPTLLVCHGSGIF